jgi:hypothetical protein
LKKNSLFPEVVMINVDQLIITGDHVSDKTKAFSRLIGIPSQYMSVLIPTHNATNQELVIEYSCETLLQNLLYIIVSSKFNVPTTPVAPLNEVNSHEVPARSFAVTKPAIILTNATATTKNFFINKK